MNDLEVQEMKYFIHEVEVLKQQRADGAIDQRRYENYLQYLADRYVVRMDQLKKAPTHQVSAHSAGIDHQIFKLQSLMEKPVWQKQKDLLKDCVQHLRHLMGR